MTTLLAIDTAAPRLQLALLLGDRVDALIEDMPTGQAERLFPAIAELLARNGTTYADLTRIAVTTGPGSFTGLRIGLSAARGLGLALNVPVLGVPSLLAYSLIGPSDQLFVVLMDAKRGEMYRKEFVRAGTPLHGEDEVLSAETAFSQIGKPRKLLNFVEGIRAVLGTGAAAASAATGATDLEAERPEADRGFVNITSLAQFAANADPGQFPPHAAYIRDADAKPQDKFRVARVAEPHP
jgi:tRNA threonylcarbamoyl adenosine modification protein YeaZ